MRFWGILLVLTLSACTVKPRYDGAEPTTPAVEPPAKGALYGRVMHASGTAAPRATVGLRQFGAGEGFVAMATGGMSCVLGGCPSASYISQTPEGTYSFPAESVREKDFSVVAEWGDRGVQAEVFLEDGRDPQRVPDLVLWEPELRIKRVGDGVLVSWPRQRPGAIYTIYSARGGQVSSPTRGTARMVPGWRVDGELFVEVRTQDDDAKFVHRSARVGGPSGRGYLNTRERLAGRDCVATHGHKRAVLRFDDFVETTDDGVTFEKVTVPQPKWGVRTTTVDAKYVCGREVDVW